MYSLLPLWPLEKLLINKFFKYKTFSPKIMILAVMNDITL